MKHEAWVSLEEIARHLGVSQDTVHRWIRERDMRVPLPPGDEQKAIVAGIEAELAGIDDLAATLRESIRLLAERRAALITAAVTGKIEVPAVTVYPESGERQELPLAAEGRAGYS